jgi:hypothetical protein
MMRHRILGAIVASALLLGAMGCTHFAEVVDRTPVTVRLRSFRTVTVQVVPGQLDADDAADFSSELTKRIGDANVFGSVLPSGSAAELVIRVTLLGKTDSGSVELRFAIDLVDAHGRSVGSYAVTADSRSDVDMGGGNFDFDSKTSKALAKATGAIVDHLVEIAK